MSPFREDYINVFASNFVVRLKDLEENLEMMLSEVKRDAAAQCIEPVWECIISNRDKTPHCGENTVNIQWTSTFYHFHKPLFSWIIDIMHGQISQYVFSHQIPQVWKNRRSTSQKVRHRYLMHKSDLDFIMKWQYEVLHFNYNCTSIFMGSEIK